MEILINEMTNVIKRMRKEIEEKKLTVKPLTDALQEEATIAFKEGNDALVSAKLQEKSQVYVDHGIADLEKYCMMQENLMRGYLKR